MIVISSFNLIQDKINLTSNNLSLISDNIANVNTPGYQRKYIDVQNSGIASSFESVLKKTNSKHIDKSTTSSSSIKQKDSYIRTDENGVDIDSEVIEMNKNKLFYSSLITLLNNEITNQKNIITSK